MDDIKVHHCGPGHYDAVVRIYNYYIENSPATFDETPYSVGARVPWFAQFSTDGPYQLLVATLEGEPAGFCCSTRFKERSAYEVSVETTAYVAADYCGRGIGRHLYATLLSNLQGQGLHGAYAGITLPNDASVHLHERAGFKQIGLFTDVGRKFDAYWSVAWFEKRL